MQKSILIEHQSLELFNGPAVFFQMFAISLKDVGHDVKFLTRKYNPKVCFPKFNSLIQVKETNLPFVNLSHLKGLFAVIFQLLTALKLIFSSYRAEIYVTDSYFSLWLIKLFTRMQCIMYVHYPDTLYIRDHSGGLLKWIYIYFLYIFEVLSVFAADRVIVNSEWTKHTAQTRLWVYRQKHIDVLYPYIKMHDIVNQESSGFIDDNRSGENSEFRFMSINRFCAFKKVDLLIKALSIMKKRLPDERFKNIKLKLVGAVSEQDYLDSMRELVKDLDLSRNVEFCLNVNNEVKIELFKTSSAFVYSTLNEHFGIGLCEAQEYFLPVIATNTGGPREIIKHASNGLLVKPDEYGFADAMQKLFEDRDLARKMGQQGNKMLETKYGVQTVNEKFLKIINN